MPYLTSGERATVAGGTALGRLPASNGLPQRGTATVLLGYVAAFAAIALRTSVKRRNR